MLYAKLLQLRLPKRDWSDAPHLDDEVALEYYQKNQRRSHRIRERSDRRIEWYHRSIKASQRRRGIAEIIHVLNDRFGTEFTNRQTLFDQIETELMQDENVEPAPSTR